MSPLLALPAYLVEKTGGGIKIKPCSDIIDISDQHHRGFELYNMPVGATRDNVTGAIHQYFQERGYSQRAKASPLLIFEIRGRLVKVSADFLTNPWNRAIITLDDYTPYGPLVDMLEASS